jgi:hypothetical protein
MSCSVDGTGEGVVVVSGGLATGGVCAASGKNNTTVSSVLI